MKKQVFLLTLLGLLSANFASVIAKDACCDTNTSCSINTTSDCNTACDLDFGHTFLSVNPHFQGGSPELISMFNSDVLANLNNEDKHGDFKVTVFGGKNVKHNRAAAFFLPYGNTTLTFDGSIQDPQTFAAVPAESVVQLTGTGAAADDLWVGGQTVAGLMLSDPATYQFDGNTDTSKILPWNFGITFAALFEPLGMSASGSAIGTGLITSPTFKSTVTPKWTYSHVGAGVALRYHFSDDKQGFFGLLTTAVQNVRSKICLHENVTSDAQDMTSDDFPATSNVVATLIAQTTNSLYGESTAHPPVATTQATAVANGLNPLVWDPRAVASTEPVGSINQAYIGSGFPTGASDDASPYAPPANAAEAFMQSAWNYGKMGCLTKKTRLADIELSLGYQWFCGDCASTNWSLGVVIPTGNKPNAEFVAQAIVGNGQHAGLFAASTTEVMMCDEQDYQVLYRLDMNGRYLFRNTQKRSFDVMGKQWSRYMMVWESEADYTAALAAANTISAFTAGTTLGNGVAQRGYKPGINSFTTDMYVKPQFQGRLNQALYFRGEHFRAELGWNVLAKQKECVELSCTWDAAPAFADSSYVGGVGLNNNRTIYNDSQTTCVNAVDNLARINTGDAPTELQTLAAIDLGGDDAPSYSDFAIEATDIDFDSVSSPAVVSHTPYLTLGYAWSSDYMPAVSVGASYEFNAANRALNQWLVYGSFEMAF